MLTISYATQADLPSWMKLVRLLRWNFPGLETEEALSEYEKNAAQEYWSQQRNLCKGSRANCWNIAFFAPSQRAFLHSDPPRLQAAGNCLKADWQNASKARRHKGYHCFHLSERGSKGQCPARALSKLGFKAGELTEEFVYPTQNLFYAQICTQKKRHVTKFLKID